MFRITTFLCLFFVLTFSLVSHSNAEDKKSTGLKIGDTVPEFTATGDDSKEWKSKDHVGKNIVVFYFYPADMTGGCTKQACAFRDHKSKLKKLGIEVVGISGDSVKNHKLFKKAYNLNFTLLADEKGKLAKIFGVTTRKGGSIKRVIDGNNKTLTRGVTTARWTFIADKSGKIVHKDTAVRAAQDSETVMKVIKKLQK